MPYKDIEKQREANKLATRRWREKKRRGIGVVPVEGVVQKVLKRKGK